MDFCGMARYNGEGHSSANSWRRSVDPSYLPFGLRAHTVRPYMDLSCRKMQRDRRISP